MDFEQYSKTDEALALIKKLKRKLELRGFDIEDYEDSDFLDEIESAIESVNERRHFVPNSTRFFEEKYKNIIIRLCICSFAKMGAEGELSHSENGISRTYAGASEHPNDILKEITPLARLKSYD